MNWQGCLPTNSRDANDYTSFEDEEAQIQAVFREALRLKKKVKELSRALRTSESDSQQVAQELGDLLQEREEALQKVTLELEMVEQTHKEHLDRELQVVQGQLEHARYELHRQDPLLVNMQTKIDVLEKTLHANLEQADKQSEERVEARFQELCYIEEQRMQEKLETFETELKIEQERSASLQGQLATKTAELVALQDQHADASPSADMQAVAAELAVLMQRQHAVQRAVQDVVEENRLLRELASAAQIQCLSTPPPLPPSKRPAESPVHGTVGAPARIPANPLVSESPKHVQSSDGSRSSRHATSLLDATVASVVQWRQFKPKVLAPPPSPEPPRLNVASSSSPGGASSHMPSRDSKNAHISERGVGDAVKMPGTGTTGTGASVILKNRTGANVGCSGRDGRTHLSRRKGSDPYTKAPAYVNAMLNLGVGGSPDGSVRSRRQGIDAEGSTQDCTASVTSGGPAALPSLRRSASRFSSVRPRT